MLPHHLDKVSPRFHSGMVEKLHGFLHPNPDLSAVERSKRMSRCRSVCCRSLRSITSEGLPGRALLAGDGQLSWLQESRRWFMATILVQIEAPSAAKMLLVSLCAHAVRRLPLTLLSSKAWWIRLQSLRPTFWKTLSPYSGGSIKKKTPNKQLDACSKCCFYKHTHVRVWPQRAKPYNLNEMAEVPPFSSGLDFGTSRNFMPPLVKILDKRPCLALFLSTGCLSSWSCRVAWRRVP
ncbi:uncharacterized protein LOC128153760 isoform X2 [Harpia harpyja]|uniref:uncharacterized protein LOC128153760 isoform X2 n=1 Tax=Harpia harpyja TaxID=202280 RepID=UPI0022B20633|nr:uncharacterized protein LOC128153760 isoform X2 [Harpia harpyja]